MEAGRLADDLIFEPGFVRDGPATISQQWYDEPDSATCSTINEVTGEIGTGVLAVPPGRLHAAARLRADGQLGSDIDFFMLPPIDPNQPTPAIGAATFASALVDTPEVRAFMEFVASPEWGERWAADPATAASSPPTSDSMPRPTATPTSIPRSRSEHEVASVAQTALAIRVVQIRRLRSDARSRSAVSPRTTTVSRGRSLLARHARLGRRDPQHRSGLRRHRRRVGRPESGGRELDRPTRDVVDPPASLADGCERLDRHQPLGLGAGGIEPAGAVRFRPAHGRAPQRTAHFPVSWSSQPRPGMTCSSRPSPPRPPFSPSRLTD